MIKILLNEIARLHEYADAQEVQMSNALGAAGVRYAATRMEQTLVEASERLIGPDEACEYTGYSKRQLRRIAKNYGKSGAPLYRLGELRPKTMTYTPAIGSRNVEGNIPVSRRPLPLPARADPGAGRVSPNHGQTAA